MHKTGFYIHNKYLSSLTLLRNKLAFLQDLQISMIFVRYEKEIADYMNILLSEAHKLNMSVVLDLYDNNDYEEKIVFKNSCIEDELVSYFDYGFDGLRIKGNKKINTVYKYSYYNGSYYENTNSSSKLEIIKRALDAKIMEDKEALLYLEDKSSKYNKMKDTALSFLGNVVFSDHEDLTYYKELLSIRNKYIDSIMNGYTSFMDMKNKDVFSFKKIKENTILVIANFKEEEVVYEHNEEISKIIFHNYENVLIQYEKIFLRPYEVIITEINE